MTDTQFLRPAPSRRVRKPGTDLLLAEAGETVERSTYWDRRISDEDVLLDRPDDAPAPVAEGRQSEDVGQ